MNSQDLARRLADKFDMSIKDTRELVDKIAEEMSLAIKEGEKLKLLPLGTFSTKRRKERTCRNPRTGDLIAIPERIVVQFKPAKELRESVASM